jgi:hypothetical protein
VFIPSNHVEKKKKNNLEVDLLQCYVFNPSPTTLIHIAHLPPNLQSFTRTPSLSLGLCLPKQIEHSPMHPIPNLNIMVELPLGVTMGSKAINKREGRQQGKT